MNRSKQILTALLLAASATAAAQNTRSGYFIDDYSYRFEMNPAFANSQDFVAMPGLGNINVGLNGNLGINDVLYNVDGKTTTFMSPSVSASELLANISDDNKVSTDIKLTLLAFGFKGMGGYNTITVNARSSAGFNVPRQLFSLLKEGVQNQEYDITDVSAYANAYAEIAIGHSHAINSDWRVGAAFKFLVGLGNINASFDNAKLTLGTDSWDITANAKLEASVKGWKYKTKVNSRTGHEYVSGAEVDNYGTNGYGVAIDMGAIYTPSAATDWSFSASLLDLGFISWYRTQLASTQGEKTFSTSRYSFSAEGNVPNSFKNQWDNIKDDISTIYELENLGDCGSQTRLLAATINAGVSYKLPVYRAMTFGLLNTTRIQRGYGWTDFRLSANVAPLKWLDGGINMDMGTYGTGFGWLVNFHLTACNLFLGMDHTLGKLAKQGVPLSCNGSVNFGLNFLF